MINRIINAIVFIEAFGEQMIGDDRVGYTFAGMLIGFAIGIIAGAYFIS